MAPWRSVGGDCGRTPSGVEVLEVLPGQPQRMGSDKYLKCNQSGAKESHITENRHSLECIYIKLLSQARFLTQDFREVLCSNKIIFELSE